MTSEWKLYVRDDSFQRQGEIEDYSEASFKPVWNDVGTWDLTLDGRSKAAAQLVNEDWGIVLTRDDVPIFSGIWTEFDRSVSLQSNGGTADEITFRGASDEIWLSDRLVSPSPAEASPPYTAQASDVRTGLGSTVIMQYVNVNLGQAAVPARAKANFSVGVDPAIGFGVRGEARWDADLLSFIKPLAETGAVTFKVVQIGNALQFQVAAPIDRSAVVKFSLNLGNMASYQYTRSRPKANYVYVGASGTGTSRIVKEFSDGDALATWERIEGALVNASSTSDANSIAQDGDDALKQNSEQASLRFTTIENDALKYGVHYFLGDYITVQLEGPTSTPYPNDAQIVDRLRGVEISLTKDGPQTVTPVVGTPVRGSVSKIVRAFQQLALRTNNLERS